MLLRRVSTPIRTIIKAAILGCVFVAGGIFAASVAHSWRQQFQQCLDEEVWGYAMSGKPTELRAALEAGGNPNVSAYPEGLLPLVEATHSSNTECVRLLLQYKADPNIRTSENIPILIYAAQTDHAEIVTLLLEHGASPNSTGVFGNTPLIEAINSFNSRITPLLLEHGADPNLANSDGDTPLLTAIEWNDGNSFKKLLAAGANPRLPNKNGLTPLAIANRDGHVGMANLLRKAGASE